MTSKPLELTADEIAMHTSWLQSLTRRLVLHQDRADDVLQETLLVALRHQGRPIRSPRPWLARVAVNLTRRLSTEDARREELEQHGAAERTEPSTDAVVARAELQHRLSEAVLAMDEPYRATILLYFLEDLSCAEVGQQMRVPIETVRTRIRRGLKSLRSRLDREHGGSRAWALPILGAAEFERLAPTGGAGVASLGLITLMGSMGKLTVVVSAATLAVLFWLLWPGTSIGDSQRNNQRQDIDWSVTENQEASSTEQRLVLAANSAGGSSSVTTGSLRVRILFSDGITPASGVQLSVRDRSCLDTFSVRARVLTDADGVVCVPGLKAGPCHVDTDRGNPFRHSVKIVAGEASSMTITLKKGLDVAGVVVTRDGTPAPGAKIMLEHTALPWRKIHIVANADADGRFIARDIACPGSLSALASGYAPSIGRSLRSFEAGAEFRLVLGGAAGSVVGRVEGSSGDAIAGALVRIGVDDGSRLLHRVTGPDGSSGLAPISLEVFTDENGQFRADGVAPGSVSIGVRSVGLSPFRGTCHVAAHLATRMDVRLVLGAVCRGIVRDSAGLPVADIEVRSGQPNTICELRTRTSLAGSYRLTGLPAGEIQLYAVGKDSTIVTKVIRVLGDESIEWNPTFTLGTSLHGRVITERGEPVPNGTVEVSAPMKDSKLRRFVGRARTDRNGCFSIPRCPEGVAVRFRGKGYARARKVEVNPGAGELVFRVRKLAMDVTIKGRVLGPAGKPVSGARVTCGSTKVRTGSDGRFTIVGLSAGSHSVRIMVKGFAGHWTDWKDLVAHETWDLGTVRVVPGGSAEVRFDRSVAGTSVPITMVITDADLRVHTASRALSDLAHIPPVAPGNYRLELQGKGIATQSIPFRIYGGELTKLAVTLARGQSCEIRLLTDETRTRVTIKDAHGLVVVDKRATRLREGGSVARTFLAPGRYAVTAQTTSGKRGAAEFSIPVAPHESVEVGVPLR